MNVFFAANLIETREKQRAALVDPSSTTRHSNRRAICKDQINDIDNLNRESAIVCAVITKICDDIGRGNIVIGNAADVSTSDNFRLRNEFDDQELALKEVGREFIRSILLYRMAILAIPKKGVMFIGNLPEHDIEFERQVNGTRVYYVCNRDSNKELYQYEPQYFVVVINEPFYDGRLDSPITSLVQEYALVMLRRAMSLAANLSNLVPMVYAVKEEKVKDSEPEVALLTVGEETVALQKQKEKERQSEEIKRAGVYMTDPLGVPIKLNETLTQVISASSSKGALEKLTDCLQAKTFKSLTVVEVLDNQKLISAGRPEEIKWTEDVDNFAQLVAMVLGYPIDFMGSMYTRVSAVASNSRDMRTDCIKTNIRILERLFEFIINGDYNHTIDEFKNNDSAAPTLPINTGEDNEVGGPGVVSLPLHSAQMDQTIESDDDNGSATSLSDARKRKLGPNRLTDGTAERKRRDPGRQEVYITFPMHMEDLLALDAIGRIRGSTMTRMLAVNFGGKPGWFNETPVLPTPPAPAGGGGFGAAKKPANRKKPKTATVRASVNSYNGVEEESFGTTLYSSYNEPPMHTYPISYLGYR